MPRPSRNVFHRWVRQHDCTWIEMPNGSRPLAHIKDAGVKACMADGQDCQPPGDDMRDTAKDLVAKDEHEVEKALRTEKRGNDWFVVSDRGGERDAVPIYLEVGTHKMAARPFLKPAARVVLASGGLLKATKMAGGLIGRTNI